jgi:hypothetical protein
VKGQSEEAEVTMSLFTRRRAEDPAATQAAGGYEGDRVAAAETAAPPRRTAFGRRSRGAAAVGTVSQGVVTLARLVLIAGVLIAVLIGLAILLRDVDANARNTIVKGIHDGANFFAGAFTGITTLHGHPKRAITIDWGIAAVCYLAAGILVAAIVRRFGRHGVAWERRHRAGAMT